MSHNVESTKKDTIEKGVTEDLALASSPQKTPPQRPIHNPFAMPSMSSCQPQENPSEFEPEQGAGQGLKQEARQGRIGPCACKGGARWAKEKC